MTFPVYPGSNPSGYNLTRSLRFRANASAYLSRTPSTPVNQPWTLSLWVKRGTLGVQQAIIQAGTNGTNDTGIYFTTNDTIDFYTRTSGTLLGYITTTPVYRDPSAWYHMVFVYNAQTATAANRMQIYVNNILQTVTVNNTLPQNTASWINSAVLHAIGALTNGSTYLDGYLTEVNFIDGQALTPSSFGSTNALTGVWQPARYTGAYGTNGYYLPFTDNSALTTSSNVGLGKDFSGNGNYWATNNISITSGVTYDSMTDVPTLTNATTANYCVMNPLNGGSNRIPPTDANLTIQLNAGGNAFFGSPATFAMTSGKWYWEVNIGTKEAAAGQWMYVGVINAPLNWPTGTWSGSLNGGFNYANDGAKGSGGGGTPSSGGAYGATWTTGDVIGVTFDADNGSLTFYKNGVSQGVAFSAIGGISNGYFPMVEFYRSTGTTQYMYPNFGQRPFTYTPPTGFVALNTYNLPTSTIVKGNTVMDATLWTGNGSTQTITNAAGFKPDFVWIKNRNNVRYHILTDSVRGTNSQLFSNDTLAQEARTDRLTAFNSNGFSVGSYTDVNLNADTFVGWQWQAGQGTNTTNTSGTITSTVSVNASAGFSVVTFSTPLVYTNATVGHGLGVTPSMFIVKNRNGAANINWNVYHQSLGNTQALYMNLTNAATTSSTFWNNTSPTSSVFTVGANLYNSSDMVAYCWTPIAGFSAFGSYTGNGSSDGPFVYTGFLPRFVMIKSTSTGNWVMIDTARNPYDVAQAYLAANSSGAEATGSPVIDVLSNGFKLRTTWTDVNGSGTGYIYAAFATNPFKQSLAF